MIDANLTGDRIISSSSDAFSWYEKSKFGEKKESHIEYSSAEALFLIAEKRMILKSGKKVVSFEDLMRKARRGDKKIETKCIVFSDLRKKGYIVKTALKYGAEFRVYDKGVKPGEEHAHWILYTAKENEQLSWHDFSAKNRIAHSTKKNLLLGIVDEEGDVSYYEVSWTRP
ncbi:MAG: tRNA-intron lyase [archaeon]|nr:tRNA-intron lyase [archaeon]